MHPDIPSPEKRLPPICVLAIVLLLGCRLAQDACAGEFTPQGQLADTPSKAGTHLEKIRTLGENAWINLGRPAPDPKYGPAQGRGWSRKMAFAPDLRGAFIYGEGVHGGSTKRGDREYYNDDLFFYDINAHAWVCCYPGTPLNNPVIKLDPETGFETNEKGAVIPVAVSVHSYWTPEYDTDRKQFMYMPNPATPYWELKLGRFRPHLYPDGKYQTGKCDYSKTPCRRPGSPYYWNPKTGIWERRKTAGTYPGCNVDNAMFYSPRLKKAVYIFRGTYLYEYASNSWKKVSNDGGGNGAFCYDSNRDRVYMVTGKHEKDAQGNWRAVPNSNRIQIYDIAANTWTTPPQEGDAGGGMDSCEVFFTYDSVNDVAILHRLHKHYVFDPKRNAWTVLPQTFPLPTSKETAEWVGWGASSGFYDPELNAHFYFNAGDSSFSPGNMWVWRYAAGGKTAENRK